MEWLQPFVRKRWRQSVKYRGGVQFKAAWLQSRRSFPGALKRKGVKPMLNVIDVILRIILVLIALVDLSYRVFTRKKD